MKNLNDSYEGYYILLEKSFLGDKLDVIKILSTREGHTTYERLDGTGYFFACDVKYAIEKKWFVPFSHTTYAELHVKEALNKAIEDAKIVLFYYENGNGDKCSRYIIDKDSILNSYSLNTIKNEKAN